MKNLKIYNPNPCPWIRFSASMKVIIGKSSGILGMGRKKYFIFNNDLVKPGLFSIKTYINKCRFNKFHDIIKLELL